MSIILLTSILITTIVYSSFSTQLQINGEAIVRSDNDIRITNVKILNQTNNAYETYNNKYTKDTTSMFVTLPSNSSITYEVEITDKVNVGYLIQSIIEISNTNSNVNIDIGLNQYDLINANSIKKFNINFTNTTTEEQNSTLVLNYKFLENRFIVTFDANGGSVDTLSKEVAYGSNYGELPTPTREGYTFKGWSNKNIFDISYLSKIDTGVTINNNVISFDSSFVEDNYVNAIQIQKRNNGNYVDLVSTNYDVGKRKSYVFTKDSTYNQIYIKLNGSKKDAGIYIDNILNDGSTYIISYNFDFIDNNNSKASISNIQIEIGSTSSEYEQHYIVEDETIYTKIYNQILYAIWNKE